MRFHAYVLGLFLLLTLGPAASWADFRSLEALAAPSAEPWPRWRISDEGSKVEIDFSPWDKILRRYLATSPGGINLFAYGAVNREDSAALDKLVAQWAALPISGYNRAQQKAYWINLYNALTVKVVLDHGPVTTIQDIDISPGFFSSGPWGKKLLRIEGEAISLNDIEHRILRPLWGDARVHYALNCASIGCPNLDARAFRADDLEARLDAAARAFINHPRGARLEGGEMVVSSIYDWFTADFGGDEAGVTAHLLHYAAPALRNTLTKHSRLDRAAYDWQLNGNF